MQGSEARRNENNRQCKKGKDCKNGEYECVRFKVRELNFLRDANRKEEKTSDREK